MAEISDLETTDSDNITRWPENMLGSSVNDSARALEGILARWFADTNGTLQTSGTSTAYTITTNRSPSALSTSLLFLIRPHTNCGATPTLKINSLDAKTIKRMNGDAIVAGDLVSGIPYLLWYDGTNFRAITLLSTLTLVGGATLLTLRRPETSSDNELLKLLGGDGTGNGVSLKGTCSATALTALKVLFGSSELFQLLSGSVKFTRLAYQAVGSLSADESNDVAWDWETKSTATLSISANATLSNPTNAVGGASGALTVTATGGDCTLDFGTGYVLPAGVSAPITIKEDSKNLIGVFYDGNDYYAVPNLQFAAA